MNKKFNDDSIKVCIRARPLFYDEIQAKISMDYALNLIEVSKDQQEETKTDIPLVLQQTNVSKSRLGNSADGKRFNYDAIYGCTTTNKQLYDSFCKELVSRVLQGYNGTIMAYGQTTSGKTHTMIGDILSQDNKGIDMFAVEQLLDYSNTAENEEVSVWISYLEIYNEVINDLLDPNGINLKIRDDVTSTIGSYVEGLTVSKLRDTDHFLQILDKGEKNRQYAKTGANEQYKNVYSSRSHTILRIIVEIKSNEQSLSESFKNEVHLTSNIKYSNLNLIDLAGSERLDDVGFDRLKETAHINTSLFVLSKVTKALADSKSAHIPYRDSKLTHLIKHSLGGNAMTSLICTISPHKDHLPLTTQTLEFARRAKNIKNSPKVNEIIDDHDVIQKCHKRIRDLEKQVVQSDNIIDDMRNEIIQKDKKISELQSIIEKTYIAGDLSKMEVKNEVAVETNKTSISTSYTKILKDEIDSLKNEVEILNKNLTLEKKCAEVYSRYYHNAKAIMHDDAQTQTNENESIEFLLFSELVNSILKGRTLKSTKLNVLMFDFISFKAEITSKIESFFAKKQKALEIEKKINSYVQAINNGDKNAKLSINENSFLDRVKNTVDKQSERINRYDPCIEDEHKDKPQVKIISNPNLLIPYDNSAVNHKNNDKTNKSFNIAERKNSNISQRIESAKRKAIKSRVISTRPNKAQIIERSTAKNSKKIVFNHYGSPVIKKSIDSKNIETISPQKLNTNLFPSIDKSKNKESDKMNTIKLFPTQNESIKELPVVPKEEAGTNTIDSSNKIEQIVSDKVENNEFTIRQDFSQNPIVNLANQKRILRKQSQRNKDILKMLDSEEFKIGGLSDDNAEDYLEDEIDSELEDNDDSNFALDSVAFQDFMARYEYLKDEMSSTKGQHKHKDKTAQTNNTFMLGDNRDGICGTEAVGPFAINPTIIYKRFAKICCGYYHNAAIDEFGKLYTWGRSIIGQLENEQNQAVPTLVPKPLKNIFVESVCCGWQHTMAVTSNGFLFSWGLNFNGQLGLGDYNDRSIPTLVLTPPVMKAA